MLRVGDKVVCIRCTIAEAEGKIGTIVRVDKTADGFPYRIRFDDPSHIWWGNGYLATDLIRALF